MNIKMFAIYDSQAACYRSPMFFKTDGLAVRAFSDAVQDKNEQNELHRHAGDFSLRHVGSFDDATGEIFPETPRQIISGDQCVAEQFIDYSTENPGGSE